MSNKLPRIEEVASILDVSEGRAWELARNGTIPCVRLGRQVRVDPTALGAWIEAGGKALAGGWRRRRGKIEGTAVAEGQG